MRIYLDCIPCFVRQSLDAARHATKDHHIHEQVVREVLRLANDLDMSQSPPAIGQQIHRLVRGLVGVEDLYHEVKSKFNDISLKLYSKMRQYITESEAPLATAVRLAIAGNIIDFGVNGTLRESDLEKTISECLAADFPDTQLKPFQQAINEADEILYIADNAGEIVFDRLLIEQLPIEKINVVVKGQPVINDATMEDAVLAGLPQIVEVIDNGSDAPGTILESCSQSFRRRFEKADLIIAKGQGNYETLSDVRKNIFFILKVKCPVIARDIGCEVGRMIFQKTKAFKGEIENATV
ncbi:MAG: DUF89 family protein [Sedimentisphaerales bacterium]|nr:DUF89 family protein [Sedimentisphaerales bacterium]